MGQEGGGKLAGLIHSLKADGGCCLLWPQLTRDVHYDPMLSLTFKFTSITWGFSLS